MESIQNGGLSKLVCGRLQNASKVIYKRKGNGKAGKNWFMIRPKRTSPIKFQLTKIYIKFQKFSPTKDRVFSHTQRSGVGICTTPARATRIDTCALRFYGASTNLEPFFLVALYAHSTPISPHLSHRPQFLLHVIN